MSAPMPEDPPRSAYDVLAELLDVCAVVDRQKPAYRSLTTDRIRDLITSGLAS